MATIETVSHKDSRLPLSGLESGHPLVTLQSIWLEEIKKDFCSGRILYENGLQSCLYHHLRVTLGPDRVYSEPFNREGDLNNSVPDVVVVEQPSEGLGRVQLVVEVKYRPWKDVTKLEYFDDVTKLTEIAKTSPEKAFLLRLDPTDGKFTGPGFHFTDDTLYVLALIGARTGRTITAMRSNLSKISFDMGDRFWLLSGWAGTRDFKVSKMPSLENLA